MLVTTSENRFEGSSLGQQPAHRMIVADADPTARHTLVELFAPHYQIELSTSLPAHTECNGAQVLLLNRGLLPSGGPESVLANLARQAPVFLYSHRSEGAGLEADPPEFALSQLRDEAGRARLLLAVDRRIREFEPPTETNPGPERSALVGPSQAMVDLRAAMKQASRSQLNLLLTGETGVGKTHVGHLIHAMGIGEKHPFVVSEPATLAATLFESDLFGHVRGAFTGATDSHIGAFETACGGTLFLDEIAEIPLPLQVKLLRAADTKIIRKLGSTVDVHLDVRIMCATNQNLAERVACGRFRPDLYYRLDELRIEIPPLRQRREDIVPLLRYFLAKAGMGHLEITAGARARLEVYNWPGNVREVRSLARRLLDRSPAECITEADLSWARPTTGEPKAGGDPEEQARQLRRSLYLKELESHGFNIRETAVALGVAYSTLRSRLKSLDLLVNKPE